MSAIEASLSVDEAVAKGKGGRRTRGARGERGGGKGSVEEFFYFLLKYFLKALDF